MRLKDNSVKPDFTAGMIIGLLIADKVYKEHGVDMTITSGKDGTHSNHSLHNSGNAADLRIWDIDVKAVAQGIRKSLNQHYDVVIEKDHIHMEYQPRTT